MFAGTHTAIVTPFRNGQVDEAALKSIIDFQFDNGVTGVVPCGTTGESPTLSHSEHSRVIEVAVAAAAARMGRTPKVACLGLAFKPDIDDLRESPAVHVASALLAQGYNVVAVEPNIQSHDKFVLMTLEEALQTTDVVAVLVKHRQFVQLAGAGELGGTAVLDFCGVLN